MSHRTPVIIVLTCLFGLGFAAAVLADESLADLPELPIDLEPPVSAAAPDEAQASYPIAGMVGQVNGQAVYAARVFEPIADELAAVGRRVPREQFKAEAFKLIERRLMEIVTNALVLGEAERDLSEGERRNLRFMVQRHREELLRLHGRGSRAVAEVTLLERTGSTLDQTLESFRQEIIVRRYLHQKLAPQINVTRRDVERYYQDNYATFNPPGTRTLRVMRVRGQAAADGVAEQLEAGESFETLARSEVNRFSASTGGLMADVAGETVLSQNVLNEAIARLAEGEQAGPIAVDGDFWFIRMERIDRPAHQPLIDAQLEIRRRLARQQEQQLTERYYQQVFMEGSYTPVSQMGEALLTIAMSRWAMPE